MKIINPIPSYLLPKVGLRSFALATSQKGNIVRAKHAHKAPRASIPNPAQTALFGSNWAKWRRAWNGYFAALWLNTLTLTDRLWWSTQAHAIPFANYENTSATRTGFQFFMWYQNRWLDLHLDTYIPFGNNAADFPHKFATPWTSPTLEAPTIVSATLPGTVIVRCLNVAPDGTTLEPESCFSLHPPMGIGPPIGVHPWYWTSRADAGDYSEFTYDLALMFPRLTHGTRAALVHRYCLRGNPYVGVERDPTQADDIPTSPPIAWSDPNNALALDNVYTQAIFPYGPGETDKLALTNVSTPIPANATILGIAVTIWRRDQTLGSFDLHCCLTYGGGLETAPDYNPNQWTYSREAVQFGSDSSLWGRTWTPAELNATDFGIHLWEQFSTGGSGNPEIDWATIFVYYSIAGDWFTDPSLTTFEWA